MKQIIILLFIVHLINAHPNPPPTATAAPTLSSHEAENDGEKSRKIIGQSVVTSVSVIMNGNEEKPYFTDAVGKTVPRPFVPPQVASPINLLTPDRYEFYTFNNKGELVKRLMTLKEIQSIVANGNGAMISDNSGVPESHESVLLNSLPLTSHDSDTKVQDIVDNVQNVLSREMENNKNFSSIPQDLLDTPNVSASWSMILPAIFGNTGDEILPHKPINMTPETEVIDTTTSKILTTTTKRSTTKAPVRTTKKPLTKVPAKIVTSTATTPVVKTTSTKSIPKTTTTTKKPFFTTKRTTQKPRPTPFRSTSRRPSPVVIVNELFPIEGNDETTKTILITSRPYTTTTPFHTTTTKLFPTTTRRNIVVKKPATHVNKIEMKPSLSAELKEEITQNESKIEKVTQSSLLPPITTVLSPVSKIQTTEKLTSTSTLPPTSMSTTTRLTTLPSTAIETKKTTIMEPSTTISMTTRQPIFITSEGSLKSSSTIVSPIKIETTTTTTTSTATSGESGKVEQEVSSEKEEETTVSSVNNSEEIRQDLAISQIIGSLQSDINVNHFYKPFEPQKNLPTKEEEDTTLMSIVDETEAPVANEDGEDEEEESTVMPIMDKSGNDINLIPDKTFLDNQLYIDEKEPIVKEIPTTTISAATQSLIDENQMITTMSSEPVHYEKLASTTSMTHSKEEDEEEISLENSEVMQTIEKLLQEQVNTKNKIHLQKLDVVSFDDDDETEIKLKDTLSSKEKLTHSQYLTKAATVASIINKISTQTPLTSTTKTTTTSTTPSSYNEDSTISTILSEALSNVIEQMMREQENRKTTTMLPPSPAITQKKTTSTPATTTTTPSNNSEEQNDLNEPSLDELNKLLHHYQELQLSSQRDELESLSLLNEKEFTTQNSNGENEKLEETSQIMQKSKISNVQSVEFTTASPNEEYGEETTTTILPVTEDPQEEFTTFFYVSDDDVSTESSIELGAFTTEQFVVTEKRISNRRDEETTTIMPSVNSSEEEDDEDDDDDADYLSKVLNAIESIGSGGGDGSVSEEENKNNNKKNNVSEESDEIENAISKISSTLDKTLKTDINTDLGITSKIASSLASVADTISETLSGDNESEENTDATISRTTVIPQDYAKKSTISTTQREMVKEEKEEVASHDESITDEDEEKKVLEETTELPVTTTIIMNEKEEEETTTMVINNAEKEEESDGNNSMIQLSVIRKEDSLEKVDLMTPSSSSSSSPSSPSAKASDEDGNFIKIESIPKLSGFKNKTAENNVKPTYITQRSTTTTDMVPPQSTIAAATSIVEQMQSKEEINAEPVTERVPLIEKASIVKEALSTAASAVASSIPMTTTTTEDNLVQIKVQTKPTITIITTTPSPSENLSAQSSTTISNAQIIKNSIKNSQQQQQQQQQLQQSRPIELSTAPKEALGLAATTANLNKDLSDFSKLCNELAFSFWKSITADGISQARSVIISPFALTSTLSMIFLGARGQTSGEMNDLLRLDDTVTFNPHVVFRNISESIEQSRNSGVAAAAFARELYSDRTKGKLLPYFKEKAQQFYGAHVEEVNFNVVNDILRRRTNLLVKKHTYNKIKEYLKTNNIWVNEPLAAVSANVFMTDCSGTTNNERDGEMFFQVSPAIRQRRLVPIPAAVYRSGFTAGYDSLLDATAVAFGDDLQSTILVMPGQQGSLVPGDNLERLENAILDSTTDAWGRLLTTFMERPGLEVQIPRFSHRSLINTTFALQQMGLKDIFNANKADLRGLTGATSSDLFFSDLLQINQFTTCGEDKIGDSHHVEIYPSPALKRGFNDADDEQQARFEMASVDASTSMQYKSLFYDPIYDSRYMSIPLPLRPRQARLPENPRLRFDRPFLYFVRHNPTGIILFMGRFNPRLLP